MTTGSVQTRTSAVSRRQPIQKEAYAAVWVLQKFRIVGTDRQTDEYGARRLAAGKNVCEVMTYVDAAGYCAAVDMTDPASS